MTVPGTTVRPWWRRPLLRWVVAGVVLRVVAVAVFRTQHRGGLAAVRRFNRRFLNPVMLRMAGRRNWYAARLEHVGRRSGRRYATPVVAQPVRAGFAVPLPYGTDVDWLRNLRAAGGGWLEVGGRRYPVTDPRVVATPELTRELPAHYRLVSREYGIRCWLVLTVAPDPDEAVRTDPAAEQVGATAETGTR
jgi:deazaflavin-dependent oxidoreductase (nitroreductase family)